MNNPFYWFIGISTVLFGGGLWLIWYVGLVAILAKHARDYPLDYAICAALIALSMLSAFDQNFSKLTSLEMNGLTWLQWAILFFKPLAAGLATFVAFVMNKTSKKDPAEPTHPMPTVKAPPAKP